MVDHLIKKENTNSVKRGAESRSLRSSGWLRYRSRRTRLAPSSQLTGSTSSTRTILIRRCDGSLHLHQTSTANKEPAVVDRLDKLDAHHTGPSLRWNSSPTSNLGIYR
ncbi:hypothetical protein QR680_000851 [Steinernema hermaphroditum]|uniref:Uncharacterized protein n=1 Tax=Steinernema hermaphroditum TaxID=289476 RepID=A0AA39LET4_9BILA|nr:hypothetical protein QR680_000851 [Steinernema hermaphroditum]